MIIEKIPDIVLQATQAADPAKRTQAINKLRETVPDVATPKAVPEVDVGTWPEAVVQVAEDPELSKSDINLQALPSIAIGSLGSADRKPSDSNPAMKFEAFVLQTFIETMLPKDSESVFGSGTSGDIWRSMLAEHIANEVARTGGIGIAQVIDKSKA